MDKLQQLQETKIGNMVLQELDENVKLKAMYEVQTFRIVL